MGRCFMLIEDSQVVTGRWNSLTFQRKAASRVRQLPGDSMLHAKEGAVFPDVQGLGTLKAAPRHLPHSHPARQDDSGEKKSPPEPPSWRDL